MIALGSDHAGYCLKERIKDLLKLWKYECQDYGTDSEESVDYPQFGSLVAEAVAKGECEKGILICGTGIGMSIAANKISGIRAALCYNVETAKAAREHNDANIIVLGARTMEHSLVDEMVRVFLITEALEGRHARRVGMITKLETQKV
ncbi:MAG: ribose 5-phosphate isomerase B [bacterium]|nr:ribose 5-phosphate isomerase B [bacterium]